MYQIVIDIRRLQAFELFKKHAVEIRIGPYGARHELGGDVYALAVAAR